MEAVRTFQQSLQSKGSGDYRVYKVVDSPLSVLTTSDERIAIAVTMTHGLENWTQVEPYAHMDFIPFGLAVYCFLLYTCCYCVEFSWCTLRKCLCVRLMAPSCASLKGNACPRSIAWADRSLIPLVVAITSVGMQCLP